MKQEQSMPVLQLVEQALARHPVFADPGYILSQLQVCMKGRLQAISRRLPVAAQLLDTLSRVDSGDSYPVIGDTVVRCAILHAHTQIESEGPHGLPLADCENVFAATIRRLEQGKVSSPLDDGSLQRLGPEPYHGWLWSEEHPSDVFGRAFRYLMMGKYGVVPRTPTRDEISMLEKGAALLKELLPLLTPSALKHANLIACVPDAGGWKGVASSSQFHLGGSIFLGHSLHSPWWVAEHLLHESLHQKLYDFRQAHSVQEIERLLNKGDGPKVISPWNPAKLNNSNLWDVNRVYAAFHVYVHLALLALVAEQRAPELADTYGPVRGMIESEKALQRAHYLAEQLKERCWDHVGLAGRQLAEWLNSALGFLHLSPPPRGAFVHLYMDHYRREANQVAALTEATGSSADDLADRLIPLVSAEIDEARAMLSAIDAQDALHKLETALATYAAADLGKQFPQVRSAIAAAVTGACVDGFRLTSSGDQDYLFKDLVFSASRRVYPLIAGLPRAVAEARRRASQLHFMKSCANEVGRLLAVLACAVPIGGRILEIGTGAGVGTAWITVGLEGRTDVEVISAELDEQLYESTREAPWPSYVRVINLDGLEALGEPRAFDLIFADAAPIKYGHIDAVIASLRPGGFLIVDDLAVGARTTDEQRLEKEALRASLRRRRDLQLVEIEAFTGVLVATRHHEFNAPPRGIELRGLGQKVQSTDRSRSQPGQPAGMEH